MALDFNLLSTTIPAEAASSAMKGMQQVNALTAGRLVNQASDMEIKNALAEQEAWKGSSTPQEAQQNLMRGGFGKSALAIGKNIADVEKTQMDTIAARLPIQREMAKDMYNDPSLNNVKNTLTYQVSRGWLTPEQAQQTWQKLSTIDDNGRREYFRTSMSKAEELMNTSDIKNFNYAKQTPGFVDYQRNNARAGATTVSMPPQEKSEQTERGKFLVDDYKTINTAARVAARTLPAIEVNTALIDKGFETGFSAETKKGAASVLAALGVKDAAVFATDAQIFQSKANEAVLQRQLEQKGPQTESDAQRITQTGAQLGNTTDANKFILNVAKAQLKRDIEQRNYYDNWFTKNKTYDGAENAWYNGDGGKSLFDRPELKKYNISPNKPSSENQKTTGGLSSTEQAELDSLRARFKR